MCPLIFLSMLLAADPGTLKVRILDTDGKTTAARVNVIGSDNAFYEPEKNPLSEYSLKRKGNRGNVTPLRYFGSFFYTDGTFEVKLPPGIARIEVSKGYSYYTFIGEAHIEEGKASDYQITLQRVIDMPRYGWHSTDTHLHFDRSDPAADPTILQLLSAEDIELGHILSKQSAKGYGMSSLNLLGRYSMVSGREITARLLGHVNQLMFHALPEPASVPSLANLYDQAIADGGAMQHDHAGYGQEIYADVALGKSDAVELLQFGLYRPQIGLDGYYLLLNTGFRYPLLGGSDYPVCRTMSDSRTFVADGTVASFPTAVGRLLRGQSFATSGPLLFLSVNGHGPGSDIDFSGDSPQTVTVKVEAVAGDLPFDSMEVVQDGKVAAQWHGDGPVFQRVLNTSLQLSQSSWIAARCSGPQTVHAHTNPVWLYFNGRAPFHADAAHELVARIRGNDSLKASAEASDLAKAAEEKIKPMPRPARLARFPVTDSNTTLFPPVLARPKLLPPANLEGTIFDTSGQPLAGVDVTVRGVGSPARSDRSGRFTLSRVDANSPLFLRLNEAAHVSTNTSYLNPRCPKESLRIVMLTRGEFEAIMKSARDNSHPKAVLLIRAKGKDPAFASSPAGITRFGSAGPNGFSAGVTEINFQPAYPEQANDHEPNVILSAGPNVREAIVLPVFANQVTFALLITD